jgi:hypothetical protein
MDPQHTHIVLIGASIGQGWDLEEWPGRTGNGNFTAEALAIWQFDKAEAVDEVLIRPRRRFRLGRSYLKSLLQPAPKRPDLVILKECSAYFPGDLNRYQARVQEWLKRLKAQQIGVMLATVVPVTKARAAQDSGKQQSLLEYNRWVRSYALGSGAPVLDLEEALRSKPEGYLNERYAAADGSHLNSAGYAVLDEYLSSVLSGIFVEHCRC